MSSEYMVAHKKLEAVLGPEVLTNADPRKFELWKQGWERLVQMLGDTGGLNRLVINQVYYATHDAEGEPLKGAPFARENAALQARYDYIARTLPDVDKITYPSTMMIGDRNHKWGVSPFHYMPSVYAHARAVLAEIFNRVVT